MLRRLRTFVANRLGVIDPAPVVRALAAQAIKGHTIGKAIPQIARGLATERTSVRRQKLQVAVAAEMLLLLPSSTRANAIEAARSAWLVEREPDLKMSWASVLLQVQKRSSTFDPRPCL
jgi:hypothetical protein